MAFRGALLGIGTDVGGPIRIPAAASGTYGFKPTFGVLPFIGYAASGYTGTNTGVPAVLGPLAHSVRDLTLVTQVLRDAKPWEVDPAVVPGVFEGAIKSRKPIVGVVHSSGIIPHPPVRRAMREAVLKLEVAGYKVVGFIPPDYRRIREVMKQLFTLDGMSYANRELKRSGEPLISCVKDIGFWDEPWKSFEEAWAWNTKKGALQKEMLDEWMKKGVDVVLCPAGPHTAVRPG
jgi:amidase